MNRRLSLLIGGSLAFWVLTAIPAARLWGDAMYANSAVALGLCLVPTVLALVWADRVLGSAPQAQLLMMLGGTGLRMMTALGVGLLLCTQVPYFSEQALFAFWGWILVFYQFTLALEVATLMKPMVPGQVLQENAPRING